MTTKSLLRVPTFCLLTTLLCSCAATKIEHTWKSPDYQGGAAQKLAIIAVDDRGLVRQGVENRFVRQLREGRATAITTFDLLSLPEINHDKPAAAERLRAAGADAVVLVRLANIANFYREARPSAERYAEVITGVEPGMWYDYYSVAYMDMSPTYGNLKQKVYIETSLFDLKTAKRLWAGLSQTVVSERMDRVAEMDPIVAKFVAAMRKDGVVP